MLKLVTRVFLSRENVKTKLIFFFITAPKLKGRPRKRRKGKEPADPNSPEGSDSNGSENSLAVAGKVCSVHCVHIIVPV